MGLRRDGVERRRQGGDYELPAVPQVEILFIRLYDCLSPNYPHISFSSFSGTRTNPMPTSSFSVTASSGFRPNASNRARCQTRSFLRQAGPRTIFLPYSSRPLPRFGMLPWDIDITVGSTPRAPHRRDCLSAGSYFAECGGVCLERLAGRLHRLLGSRRLLFREERPR